MDNFDFDPTTTRYTPSNALCLGETATLAYQDEPVIVRQANAWGFNRVRFFSRRETQAFTMANDRVVITAFRGTEPERLADWVTDADIRPTPALGGQVHEGFYRALNHVYQGVRDTIQEFQDQGQSLWFTGHSLGAALATLAVATLRSAEDKPVYGLYTFGQPRTGDRDFELRFNADLKTRAFRFVNNNDIVPRVPPRKFGYSHVGTFLYFDDEGELHSDPAWWYRLLDSIEGRVEALREPGTDGIRDHSMETGYLPNLRKNLSKYPKL